MFNIENMTIKKSMITQTGTVTANDSTVSISMVVELPHKKRSGMVNVEYLLEVHFERVIGFEVATVRAIKTDKLEQWVYGRKDLTVKFKDSLRKALIKDAYFKEILGGGFSEKRNILKGYTRKIENELAEGFVEKKKFVDWKKINASKKPKQEKSNWSGKMPTLDIF